MSQTSSHSQDLQLSWLNQDIEQRMMFRGGRATSTNLRLSCIIAVLLTVSIYALLIPFLTTSIAAYFTKRGPVPYFITFFTFWSFAILFLKWRKLAFQRRTLHLEIVPSNSEFILSPANVDIVHEQIRNQVDDPKHFVLFNRIEAALSNLRNLGRVTDVGEILQSQAEVDESAMETSYMGVTAFVWAIPVLGFIGTVLGLSSAVGGFGSVLQTSQEIDSLKSALQDVTGGLAIAFDTTLMGLLAAMVIQLIMVFLKKAELEFLDRCSEYCSRNIVNKLRLIPFQQESITEKQRANIVSHETV